MPYVFTGRRFTRRGVGQLAPTSPGLPSGYNVTTGTISGSGIPLIGTPPSVGTSYTTITTPGGDYQLVTDASGNQTLFDPDGNIVLSPSTDVFGNLEAGYSYVSGLLSQSSGGALSNLPSWALPVGIAAVVLVIGIGLAKK